MAKKKKRCARCGYEYDEYQSPIPTVDIIIEMEDDRIILVKRKNYPFGWALPGGFVDYGETVEQAARREAREETSLEVEELKQFRVYSEPDRDPRRHTISTVFTARGRGIPFAADDAAEVGSFSPVDRPSPLAFDHEKILVDYFAARRGSAALTSDEFLRG